jgi:DNA-binding NarL/FixJ family response regulator
MTVKVLIVDDHPIFREGMKVFLESDPGLSVCGEAADVESALQLVGSANPDIVLVDLSLDGSNGLQLIDQVRRNYPRVRMLVTTMHSELIYGERCIRAGANGFINKQEASANILSAIRRIMQGELYLSRELVARLVMKTGSVDQSNGSPVSGLSNRELEVFTLLGSGLSTKRIAGQLKLSTKTVDTHKEHIKRKIGASDNSQLVVRAVEWVMSTNSGNGSLS